MKVERRTVDSIQTGIGEEPIVGAWFQVTTEDGHVFDLSDSSRVTPVYGVPGLCVRTPEGGFTVHPIAFNTMVLTNDAPDDPAEDKE